MLNVFTAQYVMEMQLMYSKILQKIALCQQLSEMDSRFLEIYKATLEKQMSLEN